MAAGCEEKLALWCFVMAAQASNICFSFYQALDIFSKNKNKKQTKQTNKKKSSLAGKIFFFLEITGLLKYDPIKFFKLAVCYLAIAA